MTSDGGKNFLRTCLANIDPTLNFDKIFCYKYATREHATDYQLDKYEAILNAENIKILDAGASYVVTCFIHMEIFAVWTESVGRGNGKYPLSKYDLVAFENNVDCDFVEHLIGHSGNAKVYLFRNKTGFDKLYKEVIVPSMIT